MKIDIHTHIIPAEMPDWTKKFSYGGFIHLDHYKAGCARMMVDDKFFREIKSNSWNPEVRIQECNHHHVDKQVLSTIPVMFNYWSKPKDGLDVSKFLNDHIAHVIFQFPSTFYGLGTVPLQDVDLACSELQRCVKDLKLNGVQIGSNVNQENLNEKKFFPFWELAEKLNACIFVHPWEMMGREQISKYWLPWLVAMPAETSRAICSLLFGGVFEKFKNLRFAFAHGGGSFPATIGRIAHGFEMRPDLVAIDNSVNPHDYLGKFYLDTLVHDPLALEYLIRLWGNEKLCMGSDYPFPLGEQEPGKLIEAMNLDQETKENLLSKNALHWLFGQEKN